MTINRLLHCLKCEKFRLKHTERCWGRFLHFSRHKRNIELTRVRYPNLKRGPYSQVNENDISSFKHMLPGSERVITDPSELTGFNTDWLKICRGETFLALSGFSHLFTMLKLSNDV